jgi:hypothetical protein
VGVAAAAGLIGGGCGTSSAPSSPTNASLPRATSTTATTVRAVSPRLRILSPREGAVTGSTVTARLALTGEAVIGSVGFRYVLDGRLVRFGTTRLTFHELAPGRHRLVVALATNRSIRATRLFSVQMPRSTPATSESPVRTEPTREAPAAPETPSQTTRSTSTPTPPPAAPEGAIPQGNGGDHDSDNNGGPSDGDGNV